MESSSSLTAIGDEILPGSGDGQLQAPPLGGQRTRRARQPGDLRLFVGAMAHALVIRLAVWCIPADALLKYVDRRVGAVRFQPFHPATAEQIGWAVRAACRRVPRSTCLVEALTAQLMLSRSGQHSVLCIGVARSPDGSFLAHAWVEAQGKTLVGATKGVTYLPMPDLGPLLR